MGVFVYRLGILCNLFSYRYEGGEILEVWLEKMGIELIYLLTYLFDLNLMEF